MIPRVKKDFTLVSTTNSLNARNHRLEQKEDHPKKKAPSTQWITITTNDKKQGYFHISQFLISINYFLHALQEKEERMRQLEKELELGRLKKEVEERRKEEIRERQRREPSQERDKITAASALVIGNDLSNPDPVRNPQQQTLILLIITIPGFN